MGELILERVARGNYRLGDVGTLRALPLFSAEIEAGGTAWRLRRTVGGIGQMIRARDTTSRERVATYVPNGFLHLRGIFKGTIKHGARVLEWRANHQLGSRFTLKEGEVELAHFAAGTASHPVRVSLDDSTRLDPLLLLFCCHLTKQVVDTGKVGAVAGAAVVAGG